MFFSFWFLASFFNAPPQASGRWSLLSFSKHMYCSTRRLNVTLNLCEYTLKGVMMMASMVIRRRQDSGVELLPLRCVQLRIGFTLPVCLSTFLSVIFVFWISAAVSCFLLIFQHSLTVSLKQHQRQHWSTPSFYQTSMEQQESFFQQMFQNHSVATRGDPVISYCSSIITTQHVEIFWELNLVLLKSCFRQTSKFWGTGLTILSSDLGFSDPWVWLNLDVVWCHLLCVSMFTLMFTDIWVFEHLMSTFHLFVCALKCSSEGQISRNQSSRVCVSVCVFVCFLYLWI